MTYHYDAHTYWHFVFSGRYIGFRLFMRTFFFSKLYLSAVRYTFLDDDLQSFVHYARQLNYIIKKSSRVLYLLSAAHPGSQASVKIGADARNVHA